MGEGSNAPALVKAFPIATAIVLLALGVVAGSVFGLGDDEILVSPPGVVTEEFVRAIAHRQTGAAWRMLTRSAEAVTSPADVRGWSNSFHATFGALDAVHGTDVERRHDSALVKARIEGTRATAERVVLLVREYGEWSVARAHDVVADSVRTVLKR